MKSRGQRDLSAEPWFKLGQLRRVRQVRKRLLQSLPRQTKLEVMIYKTEMSVLILAALPMAGCGLLKPKAVEPPVQIIAALEPAVTLAPLAGQGQTAAALDESSSADKAAALAPAGGAERSLGTTSVALGSPAEQGFWLKTSLVVVAGKGRVVLANGKSIAVDLLPAQGGSLLSLSAYRALGIGLTDLPEVTVYIN